MRKGSHRLVRMMVQKQLLGGWRQEHTCNEFSCIDAHDIKTRGGFE